MNTFYKAGVLDGILVRSERRGTMLSLNETKALKGVGLLGDHRDNKEADPNAKRQVTLIQKEHLDVVASLLEQDNIDPALTRRNLVVSGINLIALKDKQFYVGSVLLEGSGPCHPCSRMEENLGLGGYSAMRGHGGITAKILSEGTIRTGDVIKLASNN